MKLMYVGFLVVALAAVAVGLMAAGGKPGVVTVAQPVKAATPAPKRPTVVFLGDCRARQLWQRAYNCLPGWRVALRRGPAQTTHSVLAHLRGSGKPFAHRTERRRRSERLSLCPCFQSSMQDAR